jgi:hypothetical protein
MEETTLKFPHQLTRSMVNQVCSEESLQRQLTALSQSINDGMHHRLNAFINMYSTTLKNFAANEEIEFNGLYVMKMFINFVNNQTRDRVINEEIDEMVGE